MQTDTLTATFAAIADPTRRAILERLMRGEASVGELAEPFDLALPTVSRHLQVLERARLITRSRDAQWRRCRLQIEPLREAEAWIRRYRAYWEENLESLARFLAGSQPGSEKPRKPTLRARRRRRS
ncbi:MAG: winged helix-turn-helix transcriptional regulator [Alphaproteobacteria bacterium]|nr:winged helix-turn-helix transcriptional regulator [Alphaproteobacteria bacterium]